TSDKTTTLAAGRNLNLATATAIDSRDAQRGDGRNWRTTLATHEVGSSIDATGDITLLAGHGTRRPCRQLRRRTRGCRRTRPHHRGRATDLRPRRGHLRKEK